MEVIDQIRLNTILFEECEKEEPNFDRIRELLKKGAEPLGKIDEKYLNEVLWEELICDSQDGNIKLSEITQIFIENGMM